MGRTARDIMNEDVVSARDDMTIRQLIFLLKSNRITGVPVLDKAGLLVGVVSESDILLRDTAFGDAVAMDSDFHTHLAADTSGDLDGLDLAELGEAHVRDIMSKTAITAESDTPIASLAEIMVTHRIHRVIIVQGSALRGIVSTMDILRAVKDGKIS
jgi:CBS domain-containing protein